MPGEKSIFLLDPLTFGIVAILAFVFLIVSVFFPVFFVILLPISFHYCPLPYSYKLTHLFSRNLPARILIIFTRIHFSAFLPKECIKNRESIGKSMNLNAQIMKIYILKFSCGFIFAHLYGYTLRVIFV